MQIKSLNIGSPQTIATTNNKFISAIRKTPTLQKVFLTKMGLKGDSCYDEKAHGGKDKALHMFCFENYTFFESRAESKLTIPTFGENITISNYHEKIARIGDTLQIGEVIVQVSEPTIRCSKIGMSAGFKQMLKWIHEEFKTGFYLRVLQEGEIDVNSPVKLLNRGSEKATIDELNRAMFCNFNKQEIIKPILEIASLSQGWKSKLRKKAKIDA
ncbi:MOSC domain-containing protein [Candidatus Uabimicrobium sp. HlEnr_7]|uniref:MOSC domain-containing protein n=1 Tax=Candidatus Uabimicrobium helgolandensis TaxID=3095367 RepID=UPI003555FC20